MSSTLLGGVCVSDNYTDPRGQVLSGLGAPLIHS